MNAPPRPSPRSRAPGQLLQVAAYEYRRNVFKKSFIFTLLSVPVLIAFSIGLGLLIESLKNNSRPVGYVDRAGVLDQTRIAPGADPAWVAEYGEPLAFVAYATE